MVGIRREYLTYPKGEKQMALTIDFEKFDKAGLKPVLKKFETAGLPIEDVEATNKAKRESGFLMKTATLIFASGQKLAVKIKAGGGVFQVKLNGKVIPIKSVDDIAKAVDEVVTYVKANEPAFTKQKEKKAGVVNVPKLKAVNTSTAAQIETISATVEQLKSTNENIVAETTAQAGQGEALSSQLVGLETQLKDEKAKTVKLELDINMIQNAQEGAI